MKRLYIILFMIFPSIIFAQSNYHEGYVLKNDGDTLKGYIDYREWAYSPLSIEFKISKADNEVKQFTPQTIRGFQITGMETYVSYLGLISTNKNMFPNVPAGIDTSIAQGAIFLKQLVTGKFITLFYNYETNKTRFFIAEKDQLPVELKYYEYYNETGTQEVFHNLYRGQLLLYAYKFNSGNQKLIKDIEQVGFEQHDLENVVDEINNVSVETQTNASNHKEKRSDLRFFGGIGISNIATTYTYSELITSTVNNSTAISQATLVHYANAFAPKIDLGFDVFVNPNVQQFIFRTELSYSFLSGQFNKPASSTATIDSDLGFTQSSFTLTPQFLFNIYNTEKFKLYLDAGFAVNIASYSNNTNGNGEATTNRSFWAYVPLQAGIVFNKKIEISFAYASFTTAANYTEISVSNKLSTSLGVKIFFN